MKSINDIYEKLNKIHSEKLNGSDKNRESTDHSGTSNLDKWYGLASSGQIGAKASDENKTYADEYKGLTNAQRINAINALDKTAPDYKQRFNFLDSYALNVGYNNTREYYDDLLTRETILPKLPDSQREKFNETTKQIKAAAESYKLDNAYDLWEHYENEPWYEDAVNSGSRTPVLDGKIDGMTDEQRELFEAFERGDYKAATQYEGDTYLAIINHEGVDKAYKYLKDNQRTWTKRNTDQQAAGWINYLNQGDFAERTAKKGALSALLSATDWATGTAGFVESLGSKIMTGDYDPNAGVFGEMNSVMGKVDESISKDVSEVSSQIPGLDYEVPIFNQNIGSILYGAAKSGLAMRAGAGAFKGLGGLTNSGAAAAYTAAAAAGSYANSDRQSYEEGAEQWEREALAMSNAALEAGTEYAPFMAFLEAGDSSTKKELLKNIGKSMLEEGAEEAVNELGSSGADYIIRGASSDYGKSKQQYMSQGMTEDEARTEALKDIGKAAATAAASGALAGGFSATTAGYSGLKTNEFSGDSIKKVGMKDEAVELINAMRNVEGSHTEERADAFKGEPDLENNGVLGSLLHNAIVDAYQSGNMEYMAKAMKLEAGITKGIDIEKFIKAKEEAQKFKERTQGVNAENVTTQTRITEDDLVGLPEALQSAIKETYKGVDFEQHVTDAYYVFEKARTGKDSDVLEYAANNTNLNAEQVMTIYQKSIQNVDEAQTRKLVDLAKKNLKGYATLGDIKYDAFDMDGQHYNGAKLKNIKDAGTRTTVGALAAAANQAGYNVQFFSSTEEQRVNGTAPNGKIDHAQNTIYIDVNAGNAKDVLKNGVLAAFSHEVTHDMELHAPTLYREVASTALNMLKNNDAYRAAFAEKYTGGQVSGLSMDNIISIEKRLMDNYDGGEHSLDDAAREIVARACENCFVDSEIGAKLLESMNEENRKTFTQKIKDTLHKLAKFFRTAAKKFRSDSLEAKALESMADEYEGLVKKWAEAFETSQRTRAMVEERAQKMLDMGVSFDDKTETVMPSYQNSQRTWNVSDYVQKRDEAADAIVLALNPEIDKNDPNYKNTKLYKEEFKRACKYIDDVNSVAALIMSYADRLDYNELDGVGMLMTNSEYIRTLDGSTLCKKRVEYQDTLSEIQRALPNTALTADELTEILSLMKEKGYETPCGLCYVESTRKQLPKYAKQFLDKYAAEHKGEYVPTMAEINTPEGLAKIRVENPKIFAEYNAFMNKKGNSKPKLFQTRAAYQANEIVDFFWYKRWNRLNVNKVAKFNLRGGLRLQSFSDFEIPQMIDMMQAIMDMSRIRLCSQAYTKVKEFAEIFGDTGVKINLSCIAKGVKDGKIIYDGVEGMKEKDAKGLRNKYSKNVGIVMVVFNDTELRAALADPEIDFVLPFHRSSWKMTEASKLTKHDDIKDYTEFQNEKKPGKNVKNILPLSYWDGSKSGRQNAERYLKICNDNGRVPKFSNLLEGEMGSYKLPEDRSIADNYWKLLIDFKMYDNSGAYAEMSPVVPQFNMQAANKILNSYDGAHNRSNARRDVVEKFTKEYKEKHPNQQYSRRDVDAYHAGDLGKSEGYAEMASGSRKTGYFGTGTYFVGDEEIIKDGGHYEKRPHEKVNFKKYNLFRPRTKDDGLLLHDFLKHVNNNIDDLPIYEMTFDERWDIKKTLDDASCVFFRDDATDAEVKKAKSDTLKVLKEYGKYSKEWRKYCNKWHVDESNLDDDDIANFADMHDDLYDGMKDASSDWEHYILEAVPLFSYKDDNGSMSFDETKAKINELLKNVSDYKASIKNVYAAKHDDSLPTVFMKSLGYEGIDVTGIKGLDNTQYGSVIYDLKGEGLARKQEIGTASFSRRDSDGYQLTDEQVEYFKDSKARDADGNLQKVCHGTLTEFYEFDRKKSNIESNLGKGFYFTNNANDVDENYANENGPDFLAKMDARADLIAGGWPGDNGEYEGWDSEYDYGEIFEKVKAEFITAGKPIAMDCYLDMKNPVYIGKYNGHGETYLFADVTSEINEDDYDDEEDYYFAIDDAAGDVMSTVVDHISENIGLMDDNDLRVVEDAILECVQDGGATLNEFSAKINRGFGIIMDEHGDAANSEIVRLACEALGYDGFIDSTVSSKFRGMHLAKDTVHFIVFNSNQAKLTSNLTPTDSNDVRYSRRGEFKSDAAYQKFLEEKILGLERRNEELRYEKSLEKTETGGNVLDRHAVNAIARNIKKEAATSMKSADISKRLYSLYMDIHNETDINGEEVDKAIWKIAKDIVNEQRPEIITDEYSADIVRSVKLTRASIDETQAAELRSALGKGWRKTIGAVFTVDKNATPLDSQWTELCNDVPGLDPDISTADQPLALLEAVDDLKKGIEVRRYDKSDDEIGRIAGLIYDNYFNARAVKTTADKYAKQAEMEKVESAAALERTKDRYESRLKAKDKEITEVRADRYEKVNAEREKGREKLNAYKENVARRKEIDSIKGITIAILDQFNENSGKNHVQDALKPAVADFLRSITYQSKRSLEGGAPTKKDNEIAVAFDKMEAIISKLGMQGTMEEGEEFNSIYDFQPGFIDDIAGIRRQIRHYSDYFPGRNVLEIMDVETLKLLRKALTIIKSASNKANKFLASSYLGEVSEIANRSRAEIDSLGGHGLATANEIICGLGWGNTLPYYYFKHLGPEASKLFDGLVEGWSTFARETREATDFMAPYKEQAKKWSKEVHTFEYPGGLGGESGKKSTLKLTTAHLMALYELEKREQARKHLYAGGIQIESYKDNGKTVYDEIGSNLSPEFVEKITGALTDEQKKIADKLQKYMQDVCGERGNEVSLKRYGIRMFGEENYFPIASVNADNDPSQRNERATAGLFRLMNMGFTKPLNEHAENAILVRNIFDVFADHTSDMAKYHALVLPVLDMIKWYNYKEKEATGEGKQFKAKSVSRSIRAAFGAKANRYFINLLEDLNGKSEIGRGNRIYSMMLRNAKTAAVGFRLSVAMLQPTAYLRAISVIDGKYLAKGMTKRSNWKEAEKYSGLALWKGDGHFDTNVSRDVRDKIRGDENVFEKFKDASMFLPEIADKWTWGHLWEASKAWAVDYSSSAVGSEKFYKDATKKFNGIILATQVIDSTITRSDWMRGKDSATQVVTVFGSEPTVTLNVMADACLQVKHDMRRGKTIDQAMARNAKKIAKSAAATVLTALAAGIAREFAGFLTGRNDDDKETPEEILERSLSELNPLSKIPYIKDILDFLDDYKPSRMDEEGLYNTVHYLKKVVSGADDMSYSEIHGMLKGLSQLTGLPVANAIDDMRIIDLWNETFGKWKHKYRIETNK